MATFRSLASRFSALFRRRELDDRVGEELEFHIGMEIEENLRRGMAPSDARAAAHRKLGNRTQVREEVHRMNTIAFLDETARDVRVSLRTLRKNPGFALTAVLVLALGLGSSTAMFSALDRILFRALPYADADRLVNLGWTSRTLGSAGLTLVGRGYLEHWKPAPEPFTSVTTIVTAVDTCDVTEQKPERLRCVKVENNFLQTMGVRLALGRDFTPEDDVRGAPPVAIISHDLWTRRFGADPAAVGRTIDLNGKPIPVIGVLPAGFAMPAVNAEILQAQQIYPIPFDVALPDGRRAQNLGGFLTAFGRLKPGVTPQQAQAAVAPIIEENGKGLPRITQDQGQPRVVPLRDYLVGDAARLARLLLGAVAGLLLIACVNVANLILARMAARNREFAVRSALGAGHARLARLALSESLMLAITGGALGLLFAAGLLRVFVRLAPSSIPEIDQASLDLRVFSVAAMLALAAGAAVGIWPALSVLRSRALQYRARATAAARPRMRFTLVTVQIALTVAMLGGSALLLRTLWNLVSVPLGYESERTVTMTVALNPALHRPGSRLPFFDRLLEHVREIPGTASATMTGAAFPSGPRGTLTIPRIDGQTSLAADDGTRVRYRAVTPGFFQTFGIPMLQGRGFVETDRGAQQTVVLSESAAKILFPSQNPIGHTVDTAVNEWARVIGVARDIRNAGPTLKPEPEFYVLLPTAYDGTTYSRNPGFDSSTMYFAIRTQSGTADATAFLKQAVADLDPKLPATGVTVEPLDDQVARLTERPRFLAWLLSAFAGLALLLAAAGLYGVASYLVTQRTRDIGVRIALGAAPGDISRQVLSEAGRWIAAGAVIGCALAWAATRAIEAQLFGVRSRDPISWAAALAVLGIALLLAVLRPAARAARVDPIEALRAD
jgi:putative ABC transport system permease protein